MLIASIQIARIILKYDRTGNAYLLWFMNSRKIDNLNELSKCTYAVPQWFYYIGIVYNSYSRLHIANNLLKSSRISFGVSSN